MLSGSVKKIENADIIVAINDKSDTNISIVKSYRLTNDLNALAIRVEDILPDFDYQSFVNEIKKIRPNVKINNQFYQIYKIIKEDKNLCVVRYLDPTNKKSSSKCFFTKDAVSKFVELYDKLIK